MESSLVMYEEEFERISQLLNRLRIDASAKIVFLVDKNGQQIAGAGEIEQVDTTSLASLTAGNVAATDGLAKLIGEKEFSILFHEGRKDNIHISIVGQRLILVVIFDERSSLGLVRLRVRKASADLERVLRRHGAQGPRDRARQTSPPRSPRSPTRTSTPCSPNELHQLRRPRDQLQDRLLRSRSVRQDDQPPVHLREVEPAAEGQADLARDRDRPHPVLRLPAARPRHGARLQDPVPPLHRARSGLLRRQPQADPQGGRRSRLRRRLPGGPRRTPTSSRSATSRRT